MDSPKTPADASTTELPSTNRSKDKHSQPANETGKKVLDAAKLGLMAVVGAPILAGKALIESLKQDPRTHPDVSSQKDKRTTNVVDATVSMLEQEKLSDGPVRMSEEPKPSQVEVKSDRKESEVTIPLKVTNDPQQLEQTGILEHDSLDHSKQLSVDEQNKIPFKSVETSIVSQEIAEKEESSKQPTYDSGIHAMETDSKPEPKAVIDDPTPAEDSVDRTVNSVSIVTVILEQEHHEQSHKNDQNTDHSTHVRITKEATIVSTVEDSIHEEPARNKDDKNVSETPSVRTIVSGYSRIETSGSPVDDSDKITKFDEPETIELIEAEDHVPVVVKSDEVLEKVGKDAEKPSSNDGLAVLNATATFLEHERIPIVKSAPKQSDIEGKIHAQESQPSEVLVRPVETSQANTNLGKDLPVHETQSPLERPTALQTDKSSAVNEASKKVANAAKLGLMAIVGAPILAGKAVIDALKKEHPEEGLSPVVPKDHPSTATTASFLDHERFPIKELQRPKETAVESVEAVLEQQEDTERKLKTPEKHVTFEFVEHTPEHRPRDESYERLPLGEAVSQGKIDPKVCRVLVDDKEMPYTVEEGLNNRNVRIYDIVDVISQKLVSFVEGEPDGLVIDELLTKHKLVELGVYDADKETFIVPNTGERLSFLDLVYNSGLIDPNTVHVKDLGRDKYEPLEVALKKHLIDKNTGHMLDNKTGKKVKFVDCCKRGWIIQREPSSENLDQSPTLSEVLDAGQFNPQTGQLVQNNQVVPIAEALRAGFIDNESVSVRDPTNGEIMPLRVAIERRIINLKLGVIMNRETQEEIDLNDAYSRGYMLEGKRKPISLEAAVRKGLYNPESGLILDTITEEMVDVQQSVRKGIVDPNISNVKDTKENVLVPLQTALDKNLIDAESGKLKDTETDELVPLDVALEKNLMDTKQVTQSLIDVLNKEFYNPGSGKILNPGNGEENILQDAIKSNLVEIESVLVRDEQKDKVVKCAEAIESGLLDDTRGVLTRPELTLDRAYQKGYILSNKKPISLADALLRGFYDPTSGLLRIDGAPAVTLKKAIADGEISTSDLIVRDPKNRGVLSLLDAIQAGLVDPVSGLVIDSGSGLSMGMMDALERGIIVAAKRRCSLSDAVFRGLYDPKSGQFSSTTTPEKMSTERAIRRGMLDPESTIVNVAGKIQPFELAVENGTVDVKRGTVVDDTGSKIDFREAFDRGLLVEVRKPISLSEALLKGIYRESSGLFMDPKTGRKLTLIQAIADKMIDHNSVQIKDPVTGFYRDLDLVDAIKSDLINGQNSNVKHGAEKITLRHAFDIGLLYDSKAPISLQRAIHQDIYDEKCGKIVDPASGRKITLHEATRKFIINPRLPCYFNERDEVMLNLFETCRAKLIDRREGVFKEPGSEVFIPLSEALALGLIVDIESAGFGLYETLAMRFYDKKSGKILHPITNRKITLEEACREDIVNPASSIVKNTVTGKFIRLDEAIKANIIDQQEGVYVLPKGNKIDLQEARRKGLIVTNQKLLSLEKAIKLQLYRSDSGTFVEPVSGDHLQLQEALDSGLLDSETTVYKDAITGQDKPLRVAINDLDIDTVKGKVLDRKTERAYNFDVAFNKGLLVTIQRPITGKILERKESIDNLLQESPSGKYPKEMSLKDALRCDIVSVDRSVVKHPTTRLFVPLKLALQENVISEQSRATIDPKQSFFVFDGNLIVYVKEPLTFDQAVESGLLDLSTGKFLYKSSASGNGTNGGDLIEVLNLKDAIGQGFVDPESVLLKDGAKKKFLSLPEAFRKGLIDADKSNVLDTNTSKLTSLQTAVDTGLLITPKRAICLMEALSYHLYNGERGTFEDPFHPNQQKTLNETIQSGLIDPTTTMVRDISNNSVIIPLLTAISNGLIDPVGGHFNIESEHAKVDLAKARDRGYLMLAEQRQAVVEKFALCEDHLSKLLEWITKVEQDIASIGGPKERVDDLRNQINSLKQIKDDIDAQSRPVASCLEQVRQLVLTGGDVLSAPEVAALESSGRELRSRVDKAQDRTGKLLRRLGGARDELGKLRSELDTFSSWLQTSRRTLEDKESTLSDLNRLSSQSESVKEFHGDVIAHQADLRFITMSAQKFVDESKDYLAVLNDFRTTLPERLPHIEQVSSSDSPIRQEVSLVTAQYRDLLNRANGLLDRLAGLGGRQREYQEAMEKVRSWLRDAQPRVSAALADPIAADPQSVQDQMNQTKTLQSEFLSQGRLIDNLQNSLDALLKSLAGRLSPSEVSSLEIPVEDVKDKYNQMLEALGDRSKLLDTALVQSQGVQDALDGLSGWINQSEDKFKLQNRPASLIKERLNEQVREHRGLLNDLESHRTSLESVTLSAQELMATASNARLAKRIETNLSDVTARFEKLLDKALKRGEFLEDTLAQLQRFNDDAVNLEHELSGLQEALDGRELATLPAETLTQRMIELTRNKEHLRSLFENCVRLGKDLLAKRDVTDTSVVRDRVKALESAWKNLDVTLEDKLKLSKQKAEQLNAYEDLKDQVLVWLSSIETRTNNLMPVAVDIDTIKLQIEEVKPLIKEHRDYGVTVDKVNDLGAQYDALIRPDSPTRKRSVYSPIKRSTVSPMRRLSGETRSPSPTKGLLVGQSPTVSPLSPGGSSGFGSRRSSQDGFQLTDLTPIQQQLTEINNRYSLVGARLNDRQNELDSVRDEVRKHQESLKTLANFLDKIQRQVPKEVISTKDEAERCNKQARKILEEMYEKQSLLDSTKAQVKDLLKRKPDVQGADRLRFDLDGVADRWKNLHDLCKDRINFSEQLRDFLDTHDNLNSWLGAKERMLTVLGPISSDPRMVQSQVQQVQVLREEFRGQQPQLNHLQEVGTSVLEYLRESSPEGQAVSSKLKNVQKKWDDLVSRLDERAQSLGAAADTSKEFDAGLNRLREALHTISDNLDALPIDRDHQETLRKIENLERQLEGQRPLLADSEAAAEALCRVLSDPASRADVNARVAAVGKQYQNLQKKLDHRKAETDAALRDGRQFAETCARTLGWLSGELGNLTERLLVSAHRPTLQHQIDTHEPVYREVMGREHEIIMLLNKGRELQEKPGQTPDRTVQRDLEKISQQWERLRGAAVDRHSRLQTCMEHCKKHSAASEIFLTWLRGAEEKLASFKPGILKKSQLNQQLKELQTLRSDVWKKSGEYESARGLGESFIAACDVDKDPIKAELQDMKDRWERLNNELLARAQALETCAKRLGDFNDELRDLEHAVGRCEDRLAAHDALGGASKDPKLLDRVKTIKEDAAALRKPLQSIRKLAGDIAVEVRAAGGDADHLKNDVDGIADRIEDLHARLDDRCGELQSAATAVSQFNDAVKALGVDLNELENQVDSLSPPAREIKTVMNQLDDVAAILGKIDRTADHVAEVERAGEQLVDSGFAPDTATTRDKISSLRKQLAKLENRARDHEDALQKALKSLRSFYDLHQTTLDDLTEVADQVKKLKPVSSELEQIRNQQEDFRRFKQRHVEPLVQNIAEINRNGQDLIRSAQGGVPTGVLEKDLEKINDRWNDLKEKMNERDRRLDVGLLQSGKFQEALDGLSKWLKDTEEMVANQKPPSADYKVVKAQLQEQKFLAKMLMDRQNSMSSLFQLGQEVAAGCDASEKAAIERQLKELMGRFDALTDAAQTRTLDLEQAMHVAKQFQDQLVPLTKWLDGAERAVKSMELVPTDEEKIQQRIVEHERLHDEILSKQPDFSELADIAGQLMELVGDDEGVVLSEKVKNITDRYTDVVQASENIGHVLNESRQGLRHLVLTYQDLVSWMENMENRLQRFRVVPVHTEKLLEQMDVLVELNEDIASRSPNVESTVEAGSELMKHISSDEALQLKDKLDSLQRRYGELATKGGDLLKHAQDTLPLVQQFHQSHVRLVDWMQAAESTLATGDSNEIDIVRLEADLAGMRPVLEAVNSVGPQLCQISPGEGASTIEGIVTRDNRRFEAIVEQIQRKAERLHLSKQRSNEVTADIDELLEWFRDMDATLRDADLPAMTPKLVRAQLQEHRSINDDISSQKGRVRDVTSAAKKVLRESQPNENTIALREKLEDLKEVVETVAGLCSNRLAILEQALPLSEHFADSHSGLVTWLNEMEHQISMLGMPALRADQIAIQQDKNERLTQSIAEHKPLLDKLNKTGEALMALVADDDAAKISEIVESDNARYAALRTELRERQNALEQALQESSQFSDKLEGMLRALQNTAEQANQADPISAHPPKIRDQIEENAALVEDIDKRSEAFAAVKRAATDVISKATNQSDPAVRDIKKKLDKLNNLWNELEKMTSKRGVALDDTFGVADKFWKQHQAVMDTLKELQDALQTQEPPAAQPQAIQKQQVALQEIRQEIDQTKPEVEQVRRTGSNLMSLCGEPDKPEVKKHIEDLDHAWDNITALYAKREENLIDAMEKAMEFHETLQNLLNFLSKAEERFQKLGPLGSDIEAVKKQIEQLKHFKDDVDPHMVEVEALNRALNRQALELTERTSAEQASAIREPLNAVNRRWESLLRGMVERQKQLENALLHLGQFQHALNELLIWINKTDANLDELKPIPGDPQLLEVELAKLKVLANDIHAHQSSVDTLNDAGRKLIENDRGSLEASTTQDKLQQLNKQWRSMLQKAADRQHELEQSLREAQAFTAEIQDLVGWLGDVDAVIGASKPVGGLPETASEQLERFMEVYNELEENRPKVETLIAQGQEYVRKQTQMKVSASNLQHTLRTLKQRWDAVVSRASDKKIKLEIALKEATEFHDALQAFVEWLTQAEKQLSSATAVSRVLET
ncbi:dystonin-like, partial [Toxorhynchites rutilus septentrionalis]|uniref:dystonin-like n=1 Tax=Toxorhynchites rutilus septentrionalis TaxID=329112 RepID=UPI00247ADAFD